MQKLLCLLLFVFMIIPPLMANAQNETDASQGSVIPSGPVDVETYPFPQTMPQNPKRVDQSLYAYDDLTEFYTMEWMSSGYPGQRLPDDQNPQTVYLSEKYNVDLTWTTFPGQEEQNMVAIRFASGDIPDFLRLSSGFKEIAMQFARTNISIDASRALSYMPNMAQYITTTAKKWATIDDDRMIGLPRYHIFGDTWGFFIRKDWLEQFGMDMPRTIEDVLAYARACTYEDPDGDGKQNTWFMGGAGGGGSLGMLYDLVCMFGHPGMNVEDGVINHPMIDGTRKAYIDFLRQLHSEGLLTPDWYTIQWNEFKQYSLNDKVGMLRYPGWNLLTEYNNVQESVEKTLAVWAPLEMPESGMYAPGGDSDALFIFTKNLNEDQGKLKRIAHMIDQMLYRGDEFFVTNRGGGPAIYPDVDFVIQENDDGTFIFQIDESTHPGWTENGSLWDYQNIGYSKIWEVFPGEPDSTGGRYEKFIMAQERYENFGIFLNQDPSAVTRTKELSDSTEIQFILGQKSMDEWNSYVDQWLKAGGEKLLEDAAETLGASKAYTVER